ncbi:MAG: hypothetical protein H6744_18185 [Deltaproteobacteria bacterium]|nr:hypothetical protein [Deltaproteobacteria bacterium]
MLRTLSIVLVVAGLAVWALGRFHLVEGVQAADALVLIGLAVLAAAVDRRRSE